MDLAGDDSWGHWKSHARASGQPIVPGEENEASVVASADGAVLPTLKAFRATQISGSAQPEPSNRKTKSSPARAAPPSKSTMPEAS